MTPLAEALAPLDLIPYLDWAIQQGGDVRLDAPDLISPQGDVLVEIKENQGGARDLRAAIVELAALQRAWNGRQVVLVIRGSRMSPSGLGEEWERTVALLAPEIGARLGLVALFEHAHVVRPHDGFLERIARRAATAERGAARPARVDRSFEVMRVLLARWLVHAPPIAVGELQRQCGLSHPTVRKALDALGSSVERRSDRSVELGGFPAEMWTRLLGEARAVRQTHLFADGSGRGADPARLLERFARLRPAGVAIGGVVAARQWHDQLDLEGLPRLDLTVHAPHGVLDLSFVERLDPALVRAPTGAPAALAVHALFRGENLFTAGSGIARADPAETLLDLNELRLVEQAEEFVRALRSTS